MIKNRKILWMAAVGVAMAVVGLTSCVEPNSESGNSIQQDSSMIVGQPEAALTQELVAVDSTEDLRIYYPHFGRIDLVTGKMPDMVSDTDVIFCCEAAYTHKEQTHFEHKNIAGDHVSGGVRYSGYSCKRNTGAFVWYDGQAKFLYQDYSYALDSAAVHGGMGFGQEMLIHEGKIMPTVREESSHHIFRALCSVNGSLCIIDSKEAVDFCEFKGMVLQYGADEAIYEDMGEGWNHSWYRNTDGNAVVIFPKVHGYCTNWLTFYK